jgi:hypothetical protein
LTAWATRDWVQKLNIERDQSLSEFSSNTGNENLDTKIRTAIGELAERVQSKRQARD